MKNERKKVILDIVSKYEVDTQETLQALLLERGFNVTQATVSRDIKQLSLIKVMGDNGNYKYSLPVNTSEKNNKNSLSVFLSEAVISIDNGMNTVVIKCHTGMANAVCARLDAVGHENIVGTLAGDDTIFILMRTVEDAEHMKDYLLKQY